MLVRAAIFSAFKGVFRQIASHLRAPLGIEKPLVIKSASFPFSLFESEMKRLRKVSFVPICFRRLFRWFSSSRTRAVSIAVAAFLIPVGVAVRLMDVDWGVEERGISDGVGVEEDCLETSPVSSDAEGSVLPPFFFRFLLEPEDFLSEWVKPRSLRLCIRDIRRSLSDSLVGNIGMMFSAR